MQKIVAQPVLVMKSLRMWILVVLFTVVTFHQILLDGDRYELFRELKATPTLLFEPNQEGYYLIHLAVLNGQIEILQDLIKMDVGES